MQINDSNKANLTEKNKTNSLHGSPTSGDIDQPTYLFRMTRAIKFSQIEDKDLTAWMRRLI